MMLGLLLSLIIGSPSYASDCADFSSLKEIYSCVKASHPQYQASLAMVEEAESRVKAAHQWQNPELQTQFLYGKFQGDEQFQNQIAIYQRISIGGKRSAEIKMADAESDTLKVTSKKGLGDTFIQYTLMLYKKRHTEAELTAIGEAVDTFQKLISQYAARRRLTNEQEVSLIIFRLSNADYLVKQARLQNELQETIEQLSLFPSFSEEKTGKSLPELKSFPEIDQIKLVFEPHLKLAESQKTLADAQLSLARSEAFSDIYIGPMAQFNANGPYRTNLFGLVLNLPLPVWNFNGAGVDAARFKTKSSDLSFQSNKTLSSMEVEHTLHRYRTYTETLSKLPSLSDLRKKRVQLEASFYRGLIPSSLIVETHRQLVESMASRNLLELETLESFLRIYQYEDRLEQLPI